MLKWIQGGISSVTGMAEPEYGKECIHTATDRVKNKQPYRETSKKDFEWLNPSSTNVETATFYFSKEDEGIAGFAQVLNSNISGIHSTGQFIFRLYHEEKKELCIWTSTKLENFRTDKCNYYADNLSLEMNEDGTEYHLKSSVNKDSIVDITVQRLTPGVKVGDDPVTYYGDNPKEPWGTMRHIFWPRNALSGTIEVRGEHTVSFENDRSMMVMAIQGMKPHHAAKAWNFLNFQSSTHSAVLMEFTTPRSYGNTKVSIGIICDKDSILAVTVDNTVTHVDPAPDSVGWPVPKAMSVDFDGISSKVTDDDATSAEKFSAHAEGVLSQLVERVDVMAEVPNFVKNIVSGVAGTKPYIYQFASEISLKVDGTTVKGLGWCEITYISEFDDSDSSA